MSLFVKATGRRELNMEEADQVVGGDFCYDGEYVYYGGIKQTPEAFTNFVYTLTDVYGLDIAIKFLVDLTGYTNSEMGLGTGNSTMDISDRDQIGVIMHRFWLNWDGISNH